MKKQKKTAPCSDWMRAWSGFIGKIHQSENGLVWKGHWQGRHGEKGMPIKHEIAIMGGVAFTRCRVHPDDIIEALRILGYNVSSVKPLE